MNVWQIVEIINTGGVSILKSPKSPKSPKNPKNPKNLELKSNR